MTCPEKLNDMPVLAHCDLPQRPGSRRACTVLVDKNDNTTFDEEYVVSVHVYGTQGWTNGHYLALSLRDAIAWFLVFTADQVGVEL